MDHPEEPATPSVEYLLEECLKVPREQRTRVLEAACAAHPEQAAELRELYASLGEVGALDVLNESATESSSHPAQLGEYRLIREIGSGGMGTVFLAEQPSLDRLVAVKIIRPDQIYFEELRDRFQREARLVAGLKHPGIVSIHGSGIQDGAPYLVMEWIEGASLGRVLEVLRTRTLPGLRGAEIARALFDGESRATEAPLFAGSWEDVALRIAAHIAEALSHAHERGIVHRDVKPSNVMLTPSGRVILLDFGLARSGSIDRITKSGSQPGSLPYMSPERLRGGGAQDDLRADIYSLGITLYELLCAELPFAGADHEELRRSILDGRCTPLRKRARGARWETETVCHHAFALAPEERYQSAAALFADLQNVLAGRPIFARPPGFVRSVRQWVRVHPRAAITAGFALVLAVALPSIWIGIERRAAEEVRLERDRAVTQTERSERLLGMVAGVLDDFVMKITSERLSEMPGFTEAMSEILAEALPYYEALIQESDERPSSKFRAARASHQLAVVENRLGRSAAALDRVEHCARTLAALQAVPGLEEQLRTLRQQSDMLEATLRFDAGEHEASLAILRASLEKGQELFGSASTTYRELDLLARGYQRFANQLRVGGHFEDALKALERSSAILGPLLAEHPRDPDHLFALASTLGEMGFLYMERRDLRAAKRTLLEAEDHWRRLFEDRGSDPAVRRHRASNLGILASLLMDLDERETADLQYLSALRAYRTLHRDYPDEPDHALEILRLQVNHARLLERLGRGDDSRSATEEAIVFGAACSPAIQAQPRFPVYMFLAHLRQAVRETNLGTLARSGRVAEELLRAESYARRVGEETARSEPDFVPNFAACHFNLARALDPLCLTGTPLRSRVVAQVAFGEAHRRTPREMFLDMMMQNARRIAEISAGLGNAEEELFWSQQSASCAEMQALRFLDGSDSHAAITHGLRRVVGVFLERGRVTEAIAEAERSVACRRFVLDAAPKDQRLAVLLQDPLFALARRLPLQVAALDERSAEPERVAMLVHIHMDWIQEQEHLSESDRESLRKPSRTLAEALKPLATDPAGPLARSLDVLRARLEATPVGGR